MNKDSFDCIYKFTIASLLLSGAADGKMQLVLLIIGISLACIALLVNLGSRAWHFLQLKPVSFGGAKLAPLSSFIAAILAGLIFPHMGHRDVESGGKAGVEVIINNAFWVGLVFLLSDFNGIQGLFLAGTEV